jgi:hypothetical protein
MATTITDVGVNVAVTFNVNTDFATDGVSAGNDGAAIASNGMPTWNLSVGHDTTQTTNVDFTAHGDATIAATDTLTIDFSSYLADDGAVIGTQAKIKHAVVMIVDPNDTTKKLRYSRNSDAAAVPLGLTRATTDYQEFFRHHLFCEPVVGSVGDKMVIINPTGVAIHVAWAVSGDSTTRT